MTTDVGQLAAALQAAARAISVIPAAELAGPDCVRLSRKVSLLSHLFEEIIEFHARQGDGNGSPLTPPEISPTASLELMLVALQAVHRFLLMSPQQQRGEASTVKKNSAIQFQYVSWQLQKAIENIPYQKFEISDEVHEQIELVCSQLRRAAGKNGSANLRTFSEIYEIFQLKFCGESDNDLLTSEISHVEGAQLLDSNVQEIVFLVAEVIGYPSSELEKVIPNLAKRLSKFVFSDALTTGISDASTAVGMTDASTIPGVLKSSAVFRPPDASLHLADGSKPHIDKNNAVVIKKHDIQTIPEDFRCPISLEVMRDPVIVSTGQTYERSSIQRWIDGGNRTCPKTQQKLQHLTLTPNYVLRSLIMQWCEMNNFEQPINGRIRKSDGSYIVVSGDRTAINDLVNKLRSGSIDEQRSAAADIRSLAKRSTDNRILIAEAGAIPVLVNLLSSEDEKTQEHAVTAVLNLSIYESNKMLIVLAGAIAPIVLVLRSGSMEARENAAAALFSLSIDDENKITIGSTPGAIDELVELLRSGSLRGRKDAATALFNLCIYQGNKARAVRAGILAPLHKMLTESSSGHYMVDEALTILSVLVSHHEGKAAITKSNLMPILIDLLRTGQPRNKENAAAILLALCKKDHENLAKLGRLGGRVPLVDLAKNGTDRAMRKANSLLEHLSRMQRS